MTAGMPPLKASSKKVTSPIFQPKVRNMFMVPGLPLPSLRMSWCLRRDTRVAKLMLPMR